MREGIVLKINCGKYIVLDIETRNEIICNASGKLRYMRLDKTSSFLPNSPNPLSNKKETMHVKLSPKAGDYCFYEDETIKEIKTRKNSLERPDIANIDQILLVFSCLEPEFNFPLLDLFLVNIEKVNIAPTIIISKMDLLKPNEEEVLKTSLKFYEKMGYRVFFISAKKNENMNDFFEIFSGKISVLAGQSGVGKSTILNNLLPGLEAETQPISKALGRGKHTTRTTELYLFRDGMVADTPGFGKLNFTGINKEILKDFFIDFNNYKKICKFRECHHINEPDCEIKRQVQEGTILKSRYDNYKKFYEELK